MRCFAGKFRAQESRKKPSAQAIFKALVLAMKSPFASANRLEYIVRLKLEVCV
jgi:hypothetical protein